MTASKQYYIMPETQTQVKTLKNSSSILIGREGEQPFPISEKFDGVSRRHAIVRVLGRDSRGEDIWEIENLKDSNVTYVREPGGDWMQVQKIRISPDTEIKLGAAHSYSFLANRLREADPNNYAYEFSRLQFIIGNLKHDTAVEQEKIDKRKRFHKLMMIIGAVVAVLGVVLTKTSLPDGFGWATAITGLSPIILYMRMLSSPDMKELNAKKQELAQIKRCPKCGRPISEEDIRNSLCPYCGAH